MRCIVNSVGDIAGMNIRSKLLEGADWREGEPLCGSPTYWLGDMVMVTIDDEHILHESLDSEIKSGLDIDIELMIYTTRHKSVSNTRSLTVHHVGNYWEARFGGKERALPVSAPNWTTEALRLLNANAKGLGYSISFEATHHGPWLETPHFFIEIGSTEQEWREDEPAMAIARTVLSLQETDYPIAVGVGGGHYAPRHTDVALTRRVSFGHIVPTYALKDKAGGEIRAALGLAVDATPGAELLYPHRKGLNGEQKGACRDFAEEKGLRIVSSEELEPI